MVEANGWEMSLLGTDPPCLSHEKKKAPNDDYGEHLVHGV